MTTYPGIQLTLPSPESVQQLFGESESTTNLIYTFPERLVECFRAADKDAAPWLLDPKSVERELAFSKLTNIRNQVAFRQHNAPARTSIVNFDFLGDMPGPITPDFLRRSGSKRPVQAAEDFNSIFAPHYRNAQAYCGWLLQQESYWRDLKAVVGLFADSFKGDVLPQQVFGTPEGANLVEEPEASVLAFKAFCDKWRLQGMATLDLPIVIEPQLTPVTLYTPNSHPSSATPFLPDIFPVSAKGTNASALENARMAIEAPHLEQWKSLVGISSKQKKKIGRYARQFRLQHYWRVLLQRYPKQLHKRKSVVEEAFGRYFDDAPSVIRRDAQDMSILIDRSLSNFL